MSKRNPLPPAGRLLLLVAGPAHAAQPVSVEPHAAANGPRVLAYGYRPASEAARPTTVFEGDGHTLNANRVERDRQAAEWFRKRL
jgi:hypothetical protein